MTLHHPAPAGQLVSRRGEGSASAQPGRTRTLLEVEDAGFIREAAERGVFAYLVDAEAEELDGALGITLQRFAEFQSLDGAFGRRAITERAKGILMERHGIDEQRAFELLRGQARNTGRKLVDVTEAVVEGYLLLPEKGR